MTDLLSTITTNDFFKKSSGVGATVFFSIFFSGCCFVALFIIDAYYIWIPRWLFVSLIIGLIPIIISTYEVTKSLKNISPFLLLKSCISIPIACVATILLKKGFLYGAEKQIDIFYYMLYFNIDGIALFTFWLYIIVFYLVKSVINYSELRNEHVIKEMSLKKVIRYIVYEAIICLCISFVLNLIFIKFSIAGVAQILSFGLIAYVLLLQNYFRYNSFGRKNIILIRKIKKINSEINRAIKILQAHINSHPKSYKKYNHVIRKVNKALSRKNIRETFEPDFEDDRTVLKVISLFSKLSEKEVGAKYIHYKNLFVKQKGLQPLTKADRKNSKEVCISNIADHIALLEGTTRNNLSEIHEINLHMMSSHEDMYKKYKIPNTEETLIHKSIIAIICLCTLIVCNIWLSAL